MCLICKNLKSFFFFGCVDGDEIITIQSLQFDLGTIEFATNNFSDDNKIGQGGFGMVYKVRN